MLRYVLAAALVALSACPNTTNTPPPQPTPAAPKPAEKKVAPLEEFWVGDATTPGMRLTLGVQLKRDDKGTWTGTLDIPIQNARNLPLVDISSSGSTLNFTLQLTGAPKAAWPVFEATVDETGFAKGTMKQGQLFPLALKRADAAAVAALWPKRPQTPKPPFPYEVVNVTYKHKSEAGVLGGTLTIPKGDGPFPAAILVTGSGSQDRDETIAQHKPFLVIADYLTRAGVVVLRVDDRGVGQTTVSPRNSTVEAHASDVETGIAKLRSHPKVDKAKVGVIGHSEGGMIAAMVAARDKTLGFAVSLAGPGVSGEVINPLQAGLIAAAKGMPDKMVEQLVEHQKKIMAAVAKDKSVEDVAKLIEAAMQVTAKGMPENQMKAGAMVAAKGVTSAWFRSFVKFDPATYWKKVKKTPVLALIGSKDLQVPADVNLAAIGKSLKKARNKKVTLKKLDGLNHLFQTADKGLVEEYGTIEETFSPKALQLLGNWIISATK